MAKIKITSDSVCDLTDQILKANDIELIPLIVNLREKTEYDVPG